MPLKITFELSDKDLKFFSQKAAAVAERAAERSEAQILAGAEALVERMSADVPAFVRDRVGHLEAMVAMLRDELWQLEGKDRERVLKAVAYFAEPNDLVPDDIPAIGFIDDAVMIELVVRSLRHELEAYADFRKVQKTKDKVSDPTDRESWLAHRREKLQERMRRRRKRDRAASSGPGSRIFRLF